MPSATHFTVIIPTRDRADTLRESLRTCVEQDYAEARFIVSNNASVDDTEAVVRAFGDPRIELISTGARIGMSQNFEFAIRHAFATGPADTFLTMLGDDDGLLKNGLATWDRYIREHPGVKAFSWPWACYFWPGCVESMPENRLFVSIEQHERTIAPAEALGGFERFEVAYPDLGRVYYGLVHRSVVESIERNGRLIHSMIPDVYLGAAITAVVDSVVVCPYPLSLPALSRHSTGGEHVIGGSTRMPSEVKAQFRTEPNLPAHPKIGAMPPSVRICELEVMFQIADLGLYPFAPDPRAFFSAAIREMAERPAEKNAEVMSRLELIARTTGWETAWEQARAESVPPAGPPIPPEARMHFLPGKISGWIEGAPYGVRNVYDAAQLVSTLLGNGDMDGSLCGQFMSSSRAFPEVEEGPEVVEVVEVKVGQSEVKRLVKLLTRTEKLLRKAVDALYRSRRWKLSRLLASPKRWRERKTDSRLETARAALGQSAAAAAELHERLQKPESSAKKQHQPPAKTT